MENVQQILGRVERIVRSRVVRWRKLVEKSVIDRRKPQGIRHKHGEIVLAFLCGMIAGRLSLREAEKLSAELGLGRRGQGVSDGAMTNLASISGEHDYDSLLVQTVRDSGARGGFTHPGFSQHWMAIDGKYSILKHYCGGLAQLFIQNGKAWWRIGMLRAVLITSPARLALGQRVMGPADSPEMDPEKAKHTGEITNLPAFVAWLRKQYGDLASNFTLDAGLWSKKLFLQMDEQGLGVFCGLKNNKPELFAEVGRLIRIEQSRHGPNASTGWQRCKKGQIRRDMWRATDKLEGWDGWKHVRQVILVRQTTRDRDGNETVEDRYFVTNVTTGYLTPKQILLLVRQHWAIENDCNWTFDMVFGEDNGAWCTQNMALLVLGVLRMIAYNLLQHLRKSHIAVPKANGETSPRPWGEVRELVLRVLWRLGSELGRMLRKAVDNTLPSKVIFGPTVAAT